MPHTTTDATLLLVWRAVSSFGQAQVHWRAETPELFTATVAKVPGCRWHMIVEALQGGHWEWMVWANDGTGHCLHAQSRTLQQAKSAAERGVAQLSVGSTVRRPSPALV